MRLGFFFFLVIPFLGIAQNQNIFYANASSLDVVEGTSFKIDFTMNNIKGTNFRPPSLKDFQVVSGPSQNSNYSNLNGKVSQQLIFSYILAPKKPGKYTIQGATCTYNGKQIKTQALEITVKKRDSKSLKALGLPSDEDIFVRIELSKDTAYMGEKVELAYKLYTRKSVQNYDIKSESDYDGFFVRSERGNKQRSVQEEVDGKIYNTQVLEKRLLYPQQTGKFVFERANINLGLPDANQRRRGFFFEPNTKAFPVTTNAANLLVMNLPPDAPKSFSGAIGKFTMQATVDKQKLSTDDAVTLKMTVMGNGDAKYILPADQDHLKDFEVYEPTTVERGEREMYGELQTIKEFSYLIVPLKAGRQNFQAEYSYFDTKKKDYVTLKSQVFPLLVEQGSSSRNVALEKSEDNARTLSGLKVVKASRKSSGSFFGGIGHISLAGIALIGLGLIIFKKRQMDIEAGIDPDVKKRSKAKSVAEKRLIQAESLMNEGEHRAFFEEISTSIFGFIADKLNVPNSEISKANVANRLRDHGIDQVDIDSARELLSKCEMAVFAGKKDGDLADVYEKTKNLINKLTDKI